MKILHITGKQQHLKTVYGQLADGPTRRHQLADV